MDMFLPAVPTLQPHLHIGVTQAQATIAARRPWRRRALVVFPQLARLGAVQREPAAREAPAPPA